MHESIRNYRTLPAGLLTIPSIFGMLALSCTASAAPAEQSPKAIDTAIFDQVFLEPLISDLPANVQRTIRADNMGFKTGLGAVFAADSDLLVLVDKKTRLPENYEPGDLAAIDELRPRISVSKPAQKIRQLAVPALMEMLEAGKTAGVTLTIISAYRSYQYQVGTFERQVKASGRAEAERVVAIPGHSQHQLGLAIDFNDLSNDFATTKAGKWLYAHAGDYGFSLSYPQGKESETGYDWESWHYRYIGRAACQLQKNYFGNSQQLMLEFLDQHGSALRARISVEPIQGAQ